jgi:hypothetical protein
MKRKTVKLYSGHKNIHGLKYLSEIQDFSFFIYKIKQYCKTVSNKHFLRKQIVGASLKDFLVCH